MQKVNVWRLTHVRRYVQANVKSSLFLSQLWVLCLCPSAWRHLLSLIHVHFFCPGFSRAITMLRPHDKGWASLNGTHLAPTKWLQWGIEYKKKKTFGSNFDTCFPPDSSVYTTNGPLKLQERTVSPSIWCWNETNYRGKFAYIVCNCVQLWALLVYTLAKPVKPWLGLNQDSSWAQRWAQGLLKGYCWKKYLQVSKSRYHWSHGLKKKLTVPSPTHDWQLATACNGGTFFVHTQCFKWLKIKWWCSLKTLYVTRKTMAQW